MNKKEDNSNQNNELKSIKEMAGIDSADIDTSTKIPQIEKESKETPFDNPFSNIEPEKVEKEVNTNFKVQEIEKQEMQNENLDIKIEEIVEKILNDKWEDFTNKVQKIVDWKESLNSKLEEMGQSYNILEEEFNKFQKKVYTKVEQYDTNILDVNSEMKALEKVFSKITPTLVNNINELKNITNDLKEIKKRN
jgi:hypothetical protein